MHPDVSLLNTCMRAPGENDYAVVKSLFAPVRVAYLDLIHDTHPIRASAGNKYEL